MLRHLPNRFEDSPSNGHLVIQSAGLLAMFQQSIDTAQPLGRSGARIYTYGRIAADEAWSIDTIEENGLLIPRSFGELDVQIRGNILVVSDQKVDRLLKRFGVVPEAAEAATTMLPAKKLYQNIGGTVLGGELIEACATYTFARNRAQVVLVGENGGYSVGLPAAREPQRVSLPELVMVIDK